MVLCTIGCLKGLFISNWDLYEVGDQERRESPGGLDGTATRPRNHWRTCGLEAMGIVSLTSTSRKSLETARCSSISVYFHTYNFHIVYFLFMFSYILHVCSCSPPCIFMSFHASSCTSGAFGAERSFEMFAFCQAKRLQWHVVHHGLHRQGEQV